MPELRRHRPCRETNPGDLAVALDAVIAALRPGPPPVLTADDLRPGRFYWVTWPSGEVDVALCDRAGGVVALLPTRRQGSFLPYRFARLGPEAVPPRRTP